MLKTQRQIKICAVINDLGIGGAQRILADLVLALPKDRFAVSVINLALVQADEIERELRSAGTLVLRCPFSSKLDVRRVLWLYRCIRSQKPDIIHSHLWVASLLSAIIGRVAGCKRFVSTEHNTTTFDTRPFWYIGLGRLYLNMNQAYCAVSKAIQQQIFKKNPTSSNKAHHIYNGIDTTFFTPQDDKKWDGEPFRVGTLVRNDPRKGFSVFAEFARIIRQKRHDVTCVAAYWTTPGNDPFIEYEKIDGTRRSVADYMRRLDVFVLPSFEEGLGLVLLEAMASGAAVVASNVGGILEIVEDEKNGLLFQVGDSKNLADHVDDLFQNPIKRRDLAQQGREDVINRFSLSVMVNKYSELYNSMMDHKHA